MASLRTRLLVGTMGSTLLLLVVFSLIVYATIRAALRMQFDRGLESTARLLAAWIEEEASEMEVGVRVEELPEFRDARHATWYEFWREDGTVATKSPLLGAEDLPPLAGTLASPIFADWRGKDGRAQRAIGLRFIPVPHEGNESSLRPQTTRPAWSLTVAQDATELHAQLRFLRRLLFTASGAVMILSLVVAALVVRRGLAPLHVLAAQIAAIHAHDLTVRVGAEGTPTEVIPIKERLNDLLARLEASFQRERRFASDTAHELRNPLAGIRATVEVALARPREGAEYRAVLGECLEIVRKMQAMVNNLLLLARLDARQMTFRQERIPLAEMVNSAWRPFPESAVARRIAFECSIPDDLTCVCDPDCLSMILSNLLDNAVTYTNDGGRIWAAARRTDHGTEVTLSNTGCSLTDEQISQVFDCFWRGDASRKDIGVHCGLGLALVHRLAGALGGSVAAERQAGGVFAVRLILPFAPEKSQRRED
jgi:two-component system heavy metal sensor histidine kinase CusS